MLANVGGLVSAWVVLDLLDLFGCHATLIILSCASEVSPVNAIIQLLRVRLVTFFKHFIVKRCRKRNDKINLHF